MKLFSHARSPWCRKVEWSLAEMNLTSKLEIEVISATNPAQIEAVTKMKEQIGKHTTMPALVNNLNNKNFVLTESSAIVFYVAEKLGYNGSFLPNTAEAKAEAHMWDRVCDINLGANILSPWLRNTLFLGNNKADEAVFAKCKDNFVKLEEKLQDTLSKHSFLMGNEFTYADVGMAHLLASLARVDGPQPTSTEVKNWLDKCLARPAYQVLLNRSEA